MAVGKNEQTLTLSEFFESVRRSFAFLKKTQRYDDLLAKSIPIERGDLGFCIPLSDLQINNPHFADAFASYELSEVVVGSKVAGAELKNLTELEQAFFITDRFHSHLALVVLAANSLQQDLRIGVKRLVVRRSISSETLQPGLQSLISWIHESLLPDQIVITDEVGTHHRGPQSVVARCGFAERNGLWALVPSSEKLGKEEILTAGPTISSRENSYVLDASRYGWNAEWAKYIKKFEESFSKYIGVQSALATSSCTGALHIALKALGIGPGDEVIVPEITWVATASAVVYVGAKPVFAEVEAGNWCMDPDKLEKFITPRTKCIIPVHTYGHPCDMDRIMEIARKNGLYVVEDAAPAIGAECRGRKAGSYGHFAAFSFQGAKMLVTGEGGMLVTSDPELYKRAYAIWDHGRTPGTFWINEVGYKYKMANILAGLGLAQLERASEHIRAKRRIADWYAEELGDFSGVKLWRESAWAKSIYWMSSLTVNPECGVSRDDFRKALKARKIDSRDAFPAISQYPMWKTEPNPVARHIGDWGVNLPSGVCLTEPQVRYVARSIKEVLSQQR